MAIFLGLEHPALPEVLGALFLPEALGVLLLPEAPGVRLALYSRSPRQVLEVLEAQVCPEVQRLP